MAMTYNDKKYSDDTVFQLIEKNFLTLKDPDVKEANEFFKNLIEEVIIPLMREDKLFRLLFQRIIYGGSFYKGTRYGKPTEFDLDFVMKLPFPYEYLKVDANHTNYGYVKIKVDSRAFNTTNWMNHRQELSKWITSDNYLDQNKFRSWMESVMTTTVKLIPCSGDCLRHTHAAFKKTGPAFTLILEERKKNIKMDIDLVPVLEFDNVPLGNGYKTISGNKKTWIAVPKPLTVNRDNIFWRMGFYEPEKEFLRGELKPVIRMLKKFRDKMKWDNSIASYYLETLLYNELENHKCEVDHFLRTSKTWLFVFALKKLEEAFQKHNLPYFWNKKYNLLANISEAEIYGYANRLSKVIKSIDACIEDEGRMILAEAILESDETDELKREYYAISNFSKLRLYN